MPSENFMLDLTPDLCKDVYLHEDIWLKSLRKDGWTILFDGARAELVIVSMIEVIRLEWAMGYAVEECASFG